MIGLIGKKIGMTQVFDDIGRLIPVTVIAVEPNKVVSRKTVEADGYNAVVLGYRDMKKIQITKPYAGQFPEGMAPTKMLRELRDFTGEAEVGKELGVSLFEGTRFVDVIAVSKGKGFQGVVKRWGFGGMRATHGVSISHRAHGSTGNRQDPGRVFKNKKMAGHMGARNRTQQNLEIVRTDAERGLLFVKGSVPGSKGGWLLVRDAMKLPRHPEAPYPAAVKSAAVVRARKTCQAS